MKWLSNTFKNPDPNDPDIDDGYWRWRSRLIEGDPMPVRGQTVEQLKVLGVIGLHAPKD